MGADEQRIAATAQGFTISPEALQEALRIARGYAVVGAPGHINKLAVALLAVVEGGRV